MRLLHFFLTVLLGFSMTLSAAEKSKKKKNKKDWHDVFEKKDFNGLPYRFIGPKDYDESQKYPLVIFLHGMGGKGDDNVKQLRAPIEVFADTATREKHPHFFLAPQTKNIWTNPLDKGKEMSLEECAKTLTERHRKVEAVKKIFFDNPKGELLKAFALIDKVIAENNIDKSRIYIIGHSMGGFGTWNALWNRPDFFAAAIPSAGVLFPQYERKKIAHIPIWFFHGDKDTVIDYDWGANLYNQMKAVSANMKFTTLTGIGHGASDYAFGHKKMGNATTDYASEKCDKTEEPLEWLFRQRKHQQ